MTETAFRPGDLVVWRHDPRDGWGYVFNVPARVVRLTRGRVQIAAELAKGGERLVCVKAEKLRLRGA